MEVIDMKGKYKAAFILPKGVKKTLCGDGWNFESSIRLPEKIKKSLIESFALEYSESYLGIDVYINENIQMSVMNDDKSSIEFISFQIYGGEIEPFKSKANSLHESAELFIPNED